MDRRPPEIGDRITWNVYGRQYYGRIGHIIGENENSFYYAGDMIVYLENPQYARQTVVVTPRSWQHA